MAQTSKGGGVQNGAGAATRLCCLELQPDYGGSCLRTEDGRGSVGLSSLQTPSMSSVFILIGLTDDEFNEI